VRLALTTADDALTQLHGSDERWFEPELYLLKGSLMARARRTGGRGDARHEAHRYLRRAYRTATELGSPTLQSRAANALRAVRPR